LGDSRRLNVTCRRFGNICSIFIGGVSVFFMLTLPTEMKLTGCSETLAYRIQTQGNNPIVRIQQSERGEKFEIKDIFCYSRSRRPCAGVTVIVFLESRDCWLWQQNNRVLACRHRCDVMSRGAVTRPCQRCWLQYCQPHRHVVPTYSEIIERVIYS